MLQRADGEVVFRTKDDNRVERVAVTTGVHHDGLVEIASGLAAGDVVVTRGQAGLADGLAGLAAQLRRHAARHRRQLAQEAARRGRPVNLLDVFIRRPILTWMLTLSMLVFGVLGYNRLGVDQFPKMEFPVVAVQAIMEGASPEVMEEDVTDVLEEQINTISGVRELRSTSSQGGAQHPRRVRARPRHRHRRPGRARQDRARAHASCPDEVEPPVVDKINPSNFPIMWIPMISERGAVELSEYTRRNVKPKLETIDGVAGIQVFGRLDRQIRIWLDGEALRARGLAATDVLDALRREHVEIPGGLVESREIEYSVKTDAEYQTLGDLEQMVVSYVDGAPVMLRDVGAGRGRPRGRAHRSRASTASRPSASAC